MQLPNDVERIAHRGAKREFPENTLQAFRRAFERGANAVELDVHATHDGVVVVHHGAELGREANDSMVEGALIAELDWAALAGVQFVPGVGIPRLIDVLAVAPAGATVYVELKGANIEKLVAAVVEGSSARCAVHSFDHEAVARFRQLAPAVPRGILFDRGALDAVRVVKAMRTAGARDCWPEHSLIDRALVDAVHEAGGRVIAWTVNSADRARTLAALGVDGLCTDDVRLLEGL